MASRPALGMEELIRRKVASIRYWRKAKHNKKHSNWNFPFSVMTYNILSQNAIENHRFLYRNCNPPFLTEDYRVSRIIPEILHSGTDIICLQEVEEFVYETRMRMVFEMNGFGSIFMRRTANKTDGCAILWRMEKFFFVAQNRIEFRSNKFQLLDRDNIGLIAVLKPNHWQAENIYLHVATTHLLFNPRRGDIKLCQLRWLLAELDQMALIEVKDEVRRYHPVILCGDFNFQPHSPLYQFVEKGRIDVKDVQSGDLSGQAEGKNCGKKLQFKKLLLHNLGISNASRFEEIKREENKSVKVPEKSVSPFVKSETDKIPNSSHPNTSSPSNADSNFIVETDSNSTDSVVFLETKDKTTRSYVTIKIDSNSSDSVRILEPDSMTTDSVPTNVGELVPPESATLNNQQASEINIQIPNYAKEAEQKFKFNLDTGSNTTESEECFTHGFKFVPAYKFQDASQKSLVTSMVGRDLCTVDHIFYNVDSKNDISRKYHEGALKLLSVYSLMTGEDLKELGGLPNAGFGSDHISLGAQFALCFHNNRR